MGRSRQRRVEDKREMGERETETQLLDTKSKHPKCNDRQVGHPSSGQLPTIRKGPSKLIGSRGNPIRAGEGGEFQLQSKR